MTHNLDVFRFEGKTPGPHVLLTGGIHGDEYEGPAALADLIAQLTTLPLSGSLTIIPVANPYAWRAATRTTPDDGLNLARNFPGNPDGSLTARLAAEIFEIARHCDYAIDLHSGGAEYRFLPLAGFYGPPDPQNPSFRAAQAFGLPVLWALPETNGVLSCELFKRGIPTVGCEYLGSGELSLNGAADYLRGILSCLALWQLLPDSYAISQPSKMYSGDWQLATAEGVFRSFVDIGAEVETGALLAEIRDHRGTILQSFTAPNPGRILALRAKAYIRPSNWGVLLSENA